MLIFRNSPHFPPKGRLNKPLARRFQNLLELVYLDGNYDGLGRFYISDSVVEKIEKELNANPPEKEKNRRGNLKERTKKRIRKRKSYIFWSQKVKEANICDAQKSWQFLYEFYRRLDNAQGFGSYQASIYELESLRLSIMDHYKINNLNDDFITEDGRLRHLVDSENKEELELISADSNCPNSPFNDEIPF